MKIIVTDCTLLTLAFVSQRNGTLNDIISKWAEPDGGDKYPQT
jgi:hypothetical protein